MNMYINTLAIVGGILTPVVVLLLIRMGVEISQERQLRIEHKIKQLEKEPPFDDEAEFYKVPNPKVIGVRLLKEGVVVWDGAIWKNKL